MSDVVEIKKEKSALDLAKEEVAKELKAEAVKKLKKKLEEKAKAQLILKNIEHELEDLIKEIESGDCY